MSDETTRGLKEIAGDPPVKRLMDIAIGYAMDALTTGQTRELFADALRAAYHEGHDADVERCVAEERAGWDALVAERDEEIARLRGEVAERTRDIQQISLAVYGTRSMPLRPPPAVREPAMSDETTARERAAAEVDLDPPLTPDEVCLGERLILATSCSPVIETDDVEYEVAMEERYYVCQAVALVRGALRARDEEIARLRGEEAAIRDQAVDRWLDECEATARRYGIEPRKDECITVTLCEEVKRLRTARDALQRNLKAANDTVEEQDRRAAQREIVARDRMAAAEAKLARVEGEARTFFDWADERIKRGMAFPEEVAVRLDPLRAALAGPEPGAGEETHDG